VNRYRVAAAAALAVAVVGCGIGQSGIAPPDDRFFFPAGIVADPSGDWLYVVNANSDLRYNAGTVVAVDLRPVTEDRTKAWAACPRNNYLPTEAAGDRFCCRDYLDDRILNCTESGYLTSSVRIGSFGDTIVQQTPPTGTSVRRLFVTVRAEPSITFIDVAARDGGMQLGCSAAAGAQGPGRKDGGECEAAWKVRTGGSTETPVSLAEEPHALALDPGLGILYVGHLSAFTAAGETSFGGVSLIDVCEPAPRLMSLNVSVFSTIQTQAVTGFALPSIGDPAGAVFATSRFSRFSPDVSELRLIDATPCVPGQGPRDVTLVAAGSFFASPYSTQFGDLRGLLFSPDGMRAYVLHRQSEGGGSMISPASLVVMDRRPNSRGEPSNVPISVVEVCRGPTKMHWHDAGRGPRIYVNCFEGGQIYVIDPESPELQAIVEAGRGPADLVFSPTDPTVAYVAGFADNNVGVIDLKPGSPTENHIVQRIGFPRASSVALR
jgi:DNA-binding beta-propeller fold protein YncE